MSNFINLSKTLQSMETDPAIARDPIKRMFVCDGQFLTANVAILEKSGDTLHKQRSHDELVVGPPGSARKPSEPGDP